MRLCVALVQLLPTHQVPATKVELCPDQSKSSTPTEHFLDMADSSNRYSILAAMKDMDTSIQEMAYVASEPASILPESGSHSQDDADSDANNYSNEDPGEDADKVKDSSNTPAEEGTDAEVEDYDPPVNRTNWEAAFANGQTIFSRPIPPRETYTNLEALEAIKADYEHEAGVYKSAYHDQLWRPVYGSWTHEWRPRNLERIWKWIRRRIRLVDSRIDESRGRQQLERRWVLENELPFCEEELEFAGEV
jgi:hypothetical protein